MGPEYYGKGIKETSDTRMDFDNMTKTTWRTKSRGAEIIFEGASEMLTEEDKQAYLDSNPQARMALELKDQLELDALGADISSNARMGYAGGGLVNGNSGGGLHLLGSAKGYGKAEAGSRKFSGDQLKGLLDSQKGIGATVKKPTVTPTQINRSINKPNVTSIRTPVKKSVVQAYEETKANIKLAPVGGSNDMTPPSAGGNDIPNFDPTFKRSKEKIKVLGISV
tara:strand:- start:802 stop:1473 length:672 start_codon:yes stop_codon:yes gene_type:complete